MHVFHSTVRAVVSIHTNQVWKKKNTHTHTQRVSYIKYKTNLKLKSVKKKKKKSGLKWLFVCENKPQITRKIKVKEDFFLSRVVLYSIFLIIYYSLL